MASVTSTLKFVEGAARESLSEVLTSGGTHVRMYACPADFHFWQYVTPQNRQTIDADFSTDELNSFLESIFTKNYAKMWMFVTPFSRLDDASITIKRIFNLLKRVGTKKSGEPDGTHNMFCSKIFPAYF